MLMLECGGNWHDGTRLYTYTPWILGYANCHYSLVQLSPYRSDSTSYVIGIRKAVTSGINSLILERDSKYVILWAKDTSTALWRRRGRADWRLEKSGNKLTIAFHHVHRLMKGDTEAF